MVGEGFPEKNDIKGKTWGLSRLELGHGAEAGVKRESPLCLAHSRNVVSTLLTRTAQNPLD